MSRSGVVASNIYEVGGLIRSNADVAWPNLQYHLGPVLFAQNGARVELAEGFMVHCSQLRQQSRGRITLASADPKHKPRISFNFLSTENDRRELREGIAIARQIVRDQAMKTILGEEISPTADVTSDSALDAYVRTMAETEFHPSCTCQMGTGDLAVVDSALRVHGIRGLRIVDASIMPQVVSANLNGPTNVDVSWTTRMRSLRKPVEKKGERRSERIPPADHPGLPDVFHRGDRCG